jgi:hypothetical protein
MTKVSRVSRVKGVNHSGSIHESVHYFFTALINTKILLLSVLLLFRTHEADRSSMHGQSKVAGIDRQPHHHHHYHQGLYYGQQY